MATLMRCTVSHWQGNKFVPEGTVRPEGHPEAIPAFFEPFEMDEPKASVVKKTTAKGDNG